MHSLLESYLAEVAAQLQPLPAKRRNEELREMRTHLENAVIINRELGQSDDEAAQNAMAQFGTPEDLGENVVWAWQRGEQKQNKRIFWKIVGSAAAICGVSGIYDSLKHHSHGLDGGALCFFLGAVALALWRCLPSKYLPAWWVWTISVHPPVPRIVQLLLIGIWVFVGLNPFSVPHALWMSVIKPALCAISVFILYYGYYREYTKHTAASTSP